MSREWKPGDVALVRCEENIIHRAMVTDAVGAGVHVVVPTYAAGHGMDANTRLYFGLGAVSRPVTIDPENREQIGAFIDAIDAQRRKQGQRVSGLTKACRTDFAQEVFREYAAPKPPKPEEPTGLGAVVEDADGRRYIRTADTDCKKPWSYANNYSDHDWRDVRAVRVLSEGVPS
jgi:hypothetical protein